MANNVYIYVIVNLIFLISFFVLLQLFDHMTRMIDELGMDATSQNFPIDDVLLSLEGMEETFADVGSSIKRALDANTYKKIKVIEQNTED